MVSLTSSVLIFFCWAISPGESDSATINRTNCLVVMLMLLLQSFLTPPVCRHTPQRWCSLPTLLNLYTGYVRQSLCQAGDAGDQRCRSRSAAFSLSQYNTPRETLYLRLEIFRPASDC